MYGYVFTSFRQKEHLPVLNLEGNIKMVRYNLNIMLEKPPKEHFVIALIMILLDRCYHGVLAFAIVLMFKHM